MDIRTLKVAVAVVGGLTAILGTCGTAQAGPLTVGASPSLRTTLEQILPIFEKEYGTTVHVVYSPSKTLHRQIEKGVPIDVFLPAGIEEVENLHKKGLTLNGSALRCCQARLSPPTRLRVVFMTCINR